MLNTLGIVQVRQIGEGGCKTGRKLGGKSLVELVVRRATDCLRLDRVIVVPASREQYEPLRQFVPADVPVFAGDFRDPLAGVAGAGALPGPGHRAVVRRQPVHRSGADRPPRQRGRCPPELRLHQLLLGQRAAGDLDAIGVRRRVVLGRGAASGRSRGSQTRRPPAGDFLPLRPSRAVQRPPHSAARGARPRRLAAEDRLRGRLGTRPGDLRGPRLGRMGLAADGRPARHSAGLARANGPSQSGRSGSAPSASGRQHQGATERR